MFHMSKRPKYYSDGEDALVYRKKITAAPAPHHHARRADQWREFKRLRIAALTESPDSFSPTAESARLALRTQQILAYETDLLEYEDLFDGSHVAASPSPF